MWKLDLLEAKFNKTTPRFPHTKKLLLARSPKFWKNFPKTEEEAKSQIDALKLEYFERKYYASEKKLTRETTRIIKADLAKWKNDKKKQEVVDFIGDDELVRTMITAKLVKCVMSSILVTKELKSDVPKYISQDIRRIINDKTHASNPSRFFINHCQNNKELNKYISSLWNNKAVKALVTEIEWSFKMVRGDLTKQEREKRESLGKNVADEGADDSEEESESETETQGDLSAYEGLVADLDLDEGELDPTIDYNQVTDEEASQESDNESEDSFFAFSDEERKATKHKQEIKKEERKYNLPQLATGYFSGGSDDEDMDDDEVVKEATTVRKNRRGQRARQKIWEKKYGKGAKHIQAERAKVASEREQRQREYEERCRRREEKAKAAMEGLSSGANNAPLGVRKPTGGTSVPFTSAAVPPKEEKIHPSWEAKRLAEEKQKVKFQGKKITFD